MKESFYIIPVGIIKKQDKKVWIEVYEKYNEALSGLDGFSHITVCYWFHENDIPEKRNVMKIHPRRNKKNPLTGVFATHSPLRPNLIGISICKILSIRGNTIHIDKIDAFDGSPLIDIKCFIPSNALKQNIRLPDWV